MMKRFLILALWAMPLIGQTPVTVQNPTFEAPVTFSHNNPAYGPWEIGSVPGWTCGPNAGVWQPAAVLYTSLQAGQSVLLFAAKETCTQDVGLAQAGTYTLTAFVGNRADGVNAAASTTVALSAGTSPLCAATTFNGPIASGTFILSTQTCSATNPSGDVIVSLSCSAPQCNVASLALAFTPATTLPSVTLAINSGSTATYDDGSVIISGPITISEQQTPTSNVAIGTITSDSSGNLTGSLTVNPNWVTNGNIVFLFGIPAAQNLLSYPVPASQFSHSSTGLTLNLVLFKAGSGLNVKSQTIALTP
jgi:hypothetical protein